MKLQFEAQHDNGAIEILRGSEYLEPTAAPSRRLSYTTRTGALLRIDGVACGAFDGQHQTIAIPGALGGKIELEVERRSLPASGLPPGDGFRWRLMLARATQRPSRKLALSAGRLSLPVAASEAVAELGLVGHSHLDVAWLWTYEEAARKAVRTFATAVRQLELDAQFVFTQSQPQLYAFVQERDPELFARVAALARAGRFDASGAALWVEPDCNIPSGESLLRQLVAGIRFAQRELGTTPRVAWLPDSFGFPSTLPTLLRHAGVEYFGTTKLAWNDTTAFPYAQFVWEGPDGARVVAAQIASIAGAFEPARIRRAATRGDILLLGEGDGGGGASDDVLAPAPQYGSWTTLERWFDGIAARARGGTLPVVRDELYLEEHRGTATTHHDCKARNAALERALRDAEEALAWAYALRATPFFLDEARTQVAAAWEIVMRAQFHDVLPGSGIAAVYAGALREYDEADALVAHVTASAQSVLPTAARRAPELPREPRLERDTFAFANDFLEARVRRDGTLAELRVPGGPNLVRRGLRLAVYVDRPKRWDAWNLDRTYRNRPRRLRATACAIVDGGLEIRYAFGGSLAVARLSLGADDPYLRVDLAVAWNERHIVLRCENALRFAARRARFGSPHGAVDRAPAPHSRAERAKFEAPGQRYARLDGPRGGVALFALDSYGWSLERRGRETHLGHSLLRAPTWPDPAADRGEHAFALAYAPYGSLAMGDLERLWERFAREKTVAMFVSEAANVLIVATKLADDGNGVVVRARECDGIESDVRLACGARALAVECVDALECATGGVASLVEGAIVARFTPYALRSFRVKVR